MQIQKTKSESFHRFHHCELGSTRAELMTALHCEVEVEAAFMKTEPSTSAELN